MSSKSLPFAVYILWHPKSTKAGELASELFKRWHGDSAGGSPSPGIPVFFISTPPDGSTLPEPVDPDIASRVAVVMLLDDVLVGDPSWHDFICRQNDLPREHKHVRVFSAQLCEKAFTFNPCMSGRNAIRWPEGYKEEKLPPGTTFDKSELAKWMINRLNHSFCRMLPSTVAKIQDEAAKVRVFISHAKLDGVKLAKRIRNYLYDQTQVDAFFDTHDIAYGDDWMDTLEDSLGSAEMVLLAIQTDQYATRFACRREVLWAKQNEVPIVVLNAVERSETRGFPYLGNVPTLRWRSAQYEDVLGALLSEVLRARYFPLRLGHLYGLAGKQTPEYLVYHPELLTLAHHKPFILTAGAAGVPAGNVGAGTRTIVYPEPPLGTEELELLRAIRQDLEFTTPAAF